MEDDRWRDVDKPVVVANPVKHAAPAMPVMPKDEPKENKELSETGA